MLESMRNMNNRLQIRYFGLIPRFYLKKGFLTTHSSLSSPHKTANSLKISNFRDDSHTPHRLLSSNIVFAELFMILPLIRLFLSPIKSLLLSIHYFLYIMPQFTRLSKER